MEEALSEAGSHALRPARAEGQIWQKIWTRQLQGERRSGWKGSADELPAPGVRGEPPGRCAGAHGAFPAGAAEVGAGLPGTRGGWERVAPPGPDAYERPLSPHAARPGERRGAGGWAASGRCDAPPRPARQVPAASPRVKVKVSPREVRRGRGGAGADLGAGAGRRRGHGWAQPPPPSQPATEARPRGLVPGGARGQQGTGQDTG